MISLLSTAVQGELVAFRASSAVLGTVSPLFSPGFVARAAKRKYPLVSSGTTAKQLDREPQARPIGYGAMIGGSLLALAAVAAIGN